MSRPKEKSAEFFVDRSLGKSIVEGLREAGLSVRSMAEVYGERPGQLLADEVWLRDAGEHDWIVLTKDDAIRHRPAERDALTEAAVRVFCLTNRIANIKADPTAYYVSSAAGTAYLIVRQHNGNDYLTTEADGSTQNNLLSLPEC